MTADKVTNLAEQSVAATALPHPRRPSHEYRDGGGTARRSEAIADAGGGCSRRGGETGADPVLEGLVDEELEVGRTRRVVDSGSRADPSDRFANYPEFADIQVRDRVRCIAYPPNWIGEVIEVRDILVGGHPQRGADARWPDAQVEGWFPLSMLRV